MERSIIFDVWRSIFHSCDVLTAFRLSFTCTFFWGRFKDEPKIARWKKLNPEYCMIEASSIGDLDLVDRFRIKLSWRKNLNIKFRAPSIFRAALNNHEHVVKYFLSGIGSAELTVWKNLAYAMRGNEEYINYLNSVFTGGYASRTYFMTAALFGELELVKWLTFFVGYDRTDPVKFNDILEYATKGGHLEIVNWVISLHSNEKESKLAAAGHFAAHYGNSDILQWVFDQGTKSDFMSSVPVWAAKRNDFTMLLWAAENDISLNSEAICEYAVSNGNLDMLIYARQKGVPWRWKTVRNIAIKRKNQEIADWLYAHKSSR
jgi:hypothetical protein